MVSAAEVRGGWLSAVEPGEFHGLSNCRRNRTHLVGFGTLLHHVVKHLQQLSDVFLAVDVKVLNDLLVGFMDVEVGRSGF